MKIYACSGYSDYMCGNSGMLIIKFERGEQQLSNDIEYSNTCIVDYQDIFKTYKKATTCRFYMEESATLTSCLGNNLIL